jgi:hypothetical protein
VELQEQQLVVARFVHAVQAVDGAAVMPDDVELIIDVAVLAADESHQIVEVFGSVPQFVLVVLEE